LICQNLPVITGKFSPFTENLLLPVNEILYQTIITRPKAKKGSNKITNSSNSHPKGTLKLINKDPSVSKKLAP
jgi:hypothetical protein